MANSMRFHVAHHPDSFFPWKVLDRADCDSLAGDFETEDQARQWARHLNHGTPRLRAASTVSFDTDQFEAAHGRKPRGVGHWAFAFDSGTVGACPWFYSGPYTEAKRAAIRQAQLLDATYVSLLS